MRLFSTHVDHLLAALEHDELPESQQGIVYAHLQTCARCRAAYEEVRTASGKLRFKTLTSPPTLWERVRAALPDESGSSASRNGHQPAFAARRRRPAIALAFCVCIAAGIAAVM